MAGLKLRTGMHWLGALKQECVKQIELKQLLCVLLLAIRQKGPRSLRGHVVALEKKNTAAYVLDLSRFAHSGSDIYF